MLTVLGEYSLDTILLHQRSTFVTTQLGSQGLFFNECHTGSHFVILSPLGRRIYRNPRGRSIYDMESCSFDALLLASSNAYLMYPE